MWRSKAEVGISYYRDEEEYIRKEENCNNMIWMWGLICLLMVPGWYQYLFKQVSAACSKMASNLDWLVQQPGHHDWHHSVCYNLFPLSYLLPYLSSTSSLFPLCSSIWGGWSLSTHLWTYLSSSVSSALVLCCLTGLSAPLITSLVVVTCSHSST